MSYNDEEAELVQKIHRSGVDTPSKFRNDYIKAIDKFIAQQPVYWAKYNSRKNAGRILDKLEERNRVPSVTSVGIVLDELVKDGLERTDGHDEAYDYRVAAETAQAKLKFAVDQADRPALTRQECEEFASMSRADIARKYWESDSYNTFAVRYRKACRVVGFTIPPQPTPLEMVGEIELTAQEYRMMSAEVMAVRQRDPRFRAAVQRLAEAGEIQ